MKFLSNNFLLLKIRRRIRAVLDLKNRCQIQIYFFTMTPVSIFFGFLTINWDGNHGGDVFSNKGRWPPSQALKMQKLPRPVSTYTA